MAEKLSAYCVNIILAEASQFWIIGLYHALCSLNMNNETTTDYILRAEQAAPALKTAGEEVSDALLIAMIIKGLPHTFSTFSALTSQ